MSGADLDALKDRLGISVFPLDAWYFDDEQCRRALLEHFQVASMEALGLGDYTLRCDRGRRAACGIFMETQKNQPVPDDPTAALYPQANIWCMDSSSRTESGADRDPAGKAETGFPSVGAGQDKDGHGCPDAADAMIEQPLH